MIVSIDVVQSTADVEGLEARLPIRSLSASTSVSLRGLIRLHRLCASRPSGSHQRDSTSINHLGRDMDVELYPPDG